MTYTSLQNSIANWFARQDLPTATFIEMAEQELNRVLRLQAMEVHVSATPEYQRPDGLWYITYPDGLIEVKTIKGNEIPLQCVSPRQMLEGLDQSYAVSNGTILLGDADPVDLVYYRKEDALSEDNQENLFTDAAADALLYLCLDHASTYMDQPGNYRQTALERIGELRAANTRHNLTGPLIQRGL